MSDQRQKTYEQLAEEFLMDVDWIEHPEARSKVPVGDRKLMDKKEE